MHDTVDCTKLEKDWFSLLEKFLSRSVLQVTLKNIRDWKQFSTFLQ